MASVHHSTDGDNMISFAHRLAGSPRFKVLFRDGMDLVEQVAAYLDGPGRDEAKDLARPVAIAYAAESMRLTTRLMGPSLFSQLPPVLQELTGRSMRMQNRIIYLDRTIRIPEEDLPIEAIASANELDQQRERLRVAFRRR